MFGHRRGWKKRLAPTRTARPQAMNLAPRTSPLAPPTYPLRPRNGGPLPKAAPKSGAWTYEAKFNGWRTLVHCPTGTMFTRKGEPLSIASEFKAVLDVFRRDFQGESIMDWLDCEAFERRHPLGRGSLVVLDAPCVQGAYEARQQLIYDELVAAGVAQPWPFLHQPPPDNALLHPAYTFTDYGVPCPPELKPGGPLVRDVNCSHTSPGWTEPFCHYDGRAEISEDVDGIWTGWVQMQKVNHALGVELFEGYVAKRNDSPYPLQLRSPDLESPDWIKHRFV